MISYLWGRVKFKEKDYLILKTEGIGFKIFLSTKDLNEIKIGQPLEIFTFLELAPQEIKLFGFLKKEKLEFFSKIRKIAGIGSLAALEISSLNFKNLKDSLKKGDLTILEKIPGIGPKKAKKIAFEISGKIFEKPKIEKDEVYQALLNLGFKKEEIEEALLKIPQNIQKRDKLKEALRVLGKEK